MKNTLRLFDSQTGPQAADSVAEGKQEIFDDLMEDYWYNYPDEHDQDENPCQEMLAETICCNMQA